MKNYWSNSKFADLIRGTKKPDCLTSIEWRDWEKQSQESHPIRYWIAETALDKIRNFIFWPIDKLYQIKYYLVNRYITKTHALTSSLKRGEWHEFDSRILHCLFDELVNFVEVEQAWFHLVFDEEKRKAYDTSWTSFGWLRTRTWRCPQAGLDHLEWASNLVVDESWGVDQSDPKYGTLTDQALTAREVLELYHWWKNVRPNREDPYDKSGWSDLCEQRREKYPDVIMSCELETEEESEESRISLENLRKIEEDYDREDEEMLIRLIKIRRSLWT